MKPASTAAPARPRSPEEVRLPVEPPAGTPHACPRCAHPSAAPWRFCAACGAAYVEPQPRPATFGQRAGASVIDWTIVGAIQFAASAILTAVAVVFTPPDVGPSDRATALTDAVYTSIPYGLGLLAVLYFAWFHSGRRGQTLGQRATRIRLVRRDGQSVSVLRAIARPFARVVSVLPFGLGFWSMAWSPASDTWHDRMTRTRVVAIDGTDPPASGGSSRTVRLLALAVPPVVFAVLLVVLVVAANAGHHPRRVPLERLAVGDCGIVPVSDEPWMRVTACTDGHDYEVVERIEHPAGPFHARSIDEHAAGRCETAVARYVGGTYDETGIDWDYVSPSEDDWDAGNRTTVCYAFAVGEWLDAPARGTGPQTTSSATFI